MNTIADRAAWVGAIERLGLPEPEQVLRADELRRFLELGFPAVNDENWKYTRTSELEAFSHRWLGSPPPSVATNERGKALAAAQKFIGEGPVLPFIFINGELDLRASAISGSAGIRIDRSLLSSAELAVGRATPFRSMNGALASAVLNIELDDDTRPASRLCFVHVASSPVPVLASPRVHIRTGAGSELTVEEYFIGTGSTELMTNAVCAFEIGAQASVTLFRVQDHDAGALHIAELSAAIAAGGRLRCFGLDTGGRLARNDLNIQLRGPEARVSLNGIYLTKGSQHIDNHIVIDHLEPDTHSRQNYAGIADGDSRVVFNGKVHVHPGADGTDASQTNRNLLLSDSAEVDTKPELEIYADDVKCTHGATVGQLDDDALFYLMARGLDRQAARQQLIKAFVYSTMSDIDRADIREQFEQIVSGKLNMDDSK